MGDVFGVPWAHLSLYLSSVECQDPCRNHKSYREVISKMKPPVIPFVPLILKGEAVPKLRSPVHILHVPVLTPILTQRSSECPERRLPRQSGFQGAGKSSSGFLAHSLASLPSPRSDFPARGE